MTRPPSFFFLQGSQELAESVAARLEMPLARHEERNFEDGEHKTRSLQSVLGHDVFVLHSLHGDATAAATTSCAGCCSSADH
jgi:ribose-phosphate pyrophosphokinase